MPCTILSLIPDIMRHYANVIVKAQHEILFFTNYLQISNRFAFVPSQHISSFRPP
jgi:hypothetical protein